MVDFRSYFIFRIFIFFGVASVCLGAAFLEEPQRQPIPPSISFISSPSYDQQNLYYPELSSRLYQGDILQAPHDDSRNAINIETYKWPNGVVPYAFNQSFDDPDEQKIVRKAMDELESKTCVRFVVRESQTEYISINKEKDQGCFAMIGYRPKRDKPLPVNLQSPECLRHSGTVQHELLHVLGLLHEQARPDRDDHVKIMWENIDMQYKNDFGKARTSEVTTFGVPYDYQSVMHYPKYAFSKNGKDTIVAVTPRPSGILGLFQGPTEDSKVVMGQRIGATDGDLEKIRRMYKCPK
ncbi:low choriolytic enzyme-like [Macrosteles quadrilineatus]|uniref:low choriolytic enzyme-like n=1 Tax=Macrosteles quadrilineatus TaxID=74068 RepID=UPI0023E23560|nr:low choriolytic enzyme-like [Macrosteles quadrilineatus]